MYNEEGLFVSCYQLGVVVSNSVDRWEESALRKLFDPDVEYSEHNEEEETSV